MLDPPKPPVIALITDMGLSDWYVGTMKGVIASVCPEARWIDICHNLTKQSVEEGAFVLRVTHSYFPRGTVFLCVIDPGVGSSRKPIAARNENFFFVAPDNGLLSLVESESSQWETRVVDNPEYHLEQPSETFHGRDIFAPAAAHLAAGEPFENLGPVLEHTVQLPWGAPSPAADGKLSGRIIYIDSYGNLMTNITREAIGVAEDPTRFRLHYKKHTIRGITPHYAAVPLNHPLMYWGSSGLLEIAFNRGSAERKWGALVGEWVELEWLS